MLSSSNNSQSGSLIVLKPKSQNKDKEAVKPYFEINKKGDKGWASEDNQTISQVSGDIFKIDQKEQEWKGDKYFTVQVYLKDDEETYLLDLRLNMATRGLFNALLGLDTFKDVEIAYFRSKSGFDTFGVTQGGDRVSWKYAIDELPKVDSVTLGNKTIKDFSKLDGFFLEKLEELGELVAKASGASNKKAVAETETSASQESDSEVGF